MLSVMAGAALEGSHSDAKQFNVKMSEPIGAGTEEPFTSYDVVSDSFDAMGLQENLLKGMHEYGLMEPYEIQRRGIVPFCKGLDVIQHARSGTGKTTTFCSGILQQLDYNVVECQALVLTPSHAIAQQFEKVMGALGCHLGVKVRALFPCTRSFRKDEPCVLEGVHVVAGTPAHIHFLFRTRFICPKSIKMIVLDEADEMIFREFQDDICDIFKFLPSKIQVGVSSNTMPLEVLEITNKFTKKPVYIVDNPTLEGIKQLYVNVKVEWKFQTLYFCFTSLSITKSVIFVNTKQKVDWLTHEIFTSIDHTVTAIHSDMDKNTRDRIVHQFWSGPSRVLVTTDFLIQGIEVEQVCHVINYDMPNGVENYLHRVGRSGRFGKNVVAVNFVTEDDDCVFSEIQKLNNVIMEDLMSCPVN